MASSHFLIRQNVNYKFCKILHFPFLCYCPEDLTTKFGLSYSFTWNSPGHDIKGTVMQIEKAQINDRIRVSKIS